MLRSGGPGEIAIAETIITNFGPLLTFLKSHHFLRDRDAGRNESRDGPWGTRLGNIYNSSMMSHS
jgi:hypothetical protein